MAARELSQALGAYQGFDPQGWVGLYRFLPVYAGLAFCIVGAVMLAFGSGRAARLSALPVGVAMGYWAMPPLWSMLQLPPLQGRLIWLPVFIFAVLGLASPAAICFALVAFPAGFLAVEALGSHEPLIPFAVVGIIAGLFGFFLWRQTLALVSGALGAWLFVLGLLSTLHAFAPFLGEAGQRMPLLVVGAAAVLMLIGAAYQLSRPSPKDLDKQKAEQARAERERREKEAVERKWSSEQREPRSRL